MSTLNTSPDPEKGSHHRNGYPSLAKWIAHDPDNESYVFRRFDKLSARNLLNLQSQLISLESELDRLDEAMWLSGNPDVILSMSRWESFKERAKDSTQPEHEKMELEQVLQGKIKQYHEALLLQSQICNLDRPSTRVLGIFRDFFSKPTPILHGKAKYMLDDEADLSALHSPPDTDPLSCFIRDHWPLRGKSYPDPRDTTQHFLESQVKWVVIIITTLFAAILLIGAITSLYFVKSPGAKLGMVAGFTSLFATSIGGLTSAKRQEVFASSAAYAAVLVVFVSGDFDKNT